MSLRWRLQDDLQLGVAEEAVGVFAVAAVGGAARGLRVGDADRLGAEHAQEGVGRHGAGADFEVVGLLQDAAVFGPEALQGEEQFLKGEGFLLFNYRRHLMILNAASPNSSSVKRGVMCWEQFQS